MKKLLSLIGAISLITSSSVYVVSCKGNIEFNGTYKSSIIKSFDKSQEISKITYDTNSFYTFISVKNNGLEVFDFSKYNKDTQTTKMFRVKMFDNTNITNLVKGKNGIWLTIETTTKSNPLLDDHSLYFIDTKDIANENGWDALFNTTKLLSDFSQITPTSSKIIKIIVDPSNTVKKLNFNYLNMYYDVTLNITRLYYQYTWVDKNSNKKESKLCNFTINMKKNPTPIVFLTYDATKDINYLINQMLIISTTIPEVDIFATTNGLESINSNKIDTGSTFYTNSIKTGSNVTQLLYSNIFNSKKQLFFIAYTLFYLNLPNDLTSGTPRTLNDSGQNIYYHGSHVDYITLTKSGWLLIFLHDSGIISYQKTDVDNYIYGYIYTNTRLYTRDSKNLLWFVDSNSVHVLKAKLDDEHNSTTEVFKWRSGGEITNLALLQETRIIPWFGLYYIPNYGLYVIY